MGSQAHIVLGYLVMLTQVGTQCLFKHSGRSSSTSGGVMGCVLKSMQVWELIVEASKDSYKHTWRHLIHQGWRKEPVLIPRDI